MGAAMFRRLAALMFVLIAACGGDESLPAPAAQAPLADLGAEPAPVDLEGAAATVTPPSGRWRRTAQSLGPDQWFVQYLSEDGGVLLRTFVFPVRQSRDPSSLLMQAVDTFFRGIGVEGFGMPSRRTRAVWGAVAADGDLNAAVKGVKVVGSARLLLAGPDTWALAIGYAPADGPVEVRDAVRRFTGSLEPRDPRFYARVFRSAADLAAVVLKPKDEEVLTGADLAALHLILEAGAGVRFPLAARTSILDTLIAEAAQNTPAGRAAYRQAAPALEKSAALSAEERAQGMHTLGRRMLEALFTRANEMHEPAMRFSNLWRHLRTVAVGTSVDGLSVAALASANEMSAFLASVAADREVVLEGKAGVDLQKTLTEDLEARWASLDAAEKTALRAAGATWAHLRRAFDLAQQEDRAAFRRALVAELSDPGSREAVSALHPGRPLMAWMHARRSPERAVGLVRRAFALTATQRAELIGLLAVEEKPHQLGW